MLAVYIGHVRALRAALSTKFDVVQVEGRHLMRSTPQDRIMYLQRYSTALWSTLTDCRYSIIASVSKCGVLMLMAAQGLLKCAAFISGIAATQTVVAQEREQSPPCDSGGRTTCHSGIALRFEFVCNVGCCDPSQMLPGTQYNDLRTSIRLTTKSPRVPGYGDSDLDLEGRALVTRVPEDCSRVQQQWEENMRGLLTSKLVRPDWDARVGHNSDEAGARVKA
jgi:hypothetical protein